MNLPASVAGKGLVQGVKQDSMSIESNLIEACHWKIRWYLDGINFFTINSNQVDATTWANATNHGFFIILDVAIGGNFPAVFGGGPTSSTISGIPMLVDYVRVYTKGPKKKRGQLTSQ
jgi:hypothetical protein